MKGRLHHFQWKRTTKCLIMFGMLAKNGSHSVLSSATRLVVNVSYIATLPHLQTCLQTRVILAVNHATQFVICLSCPLSLLNVYHIFSIRFFDLKAFSSHSRLRTCCRFTKYWKCLYNPTHSDPSSSAAESNPQRRRHGHASDRATIAHRSRTILRHFQRRFALQSVSSREGKSHDNARNESDPAS